MTLNERAEQLAREGKCIICEAPAKNLVRGLCRKHHGRYKAAIAKLPVSQRLAYEELAISQGKLLPNRQGRHIGDEVDDFAELLDAFRKTHGREPAAGAAELAAEAADVADAIQAADAARRAKPKRAAKKS